jgi:hypothetical protein
MDSKEPEKIVTFDIGCLPEAAVSGPLFIQTERSAFLLFNAVREVSETRRDEAGTAVVELPGCLVTRLGYPNDEGHHESPFYNDLAYGVYEVINSIWVRQLRDYRKTRFPNPNPDWWGLEGRHFVFTFHDSTFECISGAPKATATTEPRTSVHRKLLERIEAE